MLSSKAPYLFLIISPFSKPSRLENFRGVYILLGENRDEILDFINRKIMEVSARESE